MFTESHPNKSPFQQKENVSRFNNRIPMNNINNNRYHFQFSDHMLEPTVHLTINIMMVKKMIDLIPAQIHKIKPIGFRFIEFCGKVQSSKPPMFSDQTQIITINDEDLNMGSEMLGEYALVYLQKTKDGMLKVREIRKVEPKQVELHNLLVERTKKLYPHLTGNPSKSEEFVTRSDKEPLVREKVEVNKVPELTEIQKLLVINWMKGREEFDLNEVHKEFSLISKESVTRYLEAAGLEGNLANLGNKFLWLG